MVPHKQIQMCCYVLKVLYNKWLSHAKVMVENTFGILKETFKELMIKSNLNVLLLLDVVICYYMLHNMILNDKDFNINELIFWLEKQKMCQKLKKVWWGEILIKGHKVMKVMNLMLNLHCKGVRFLGSTIALQ